jgi:hypothetical protein
MKLHPFLGMTITSDPAMDLTVEDQDGRSVQDQDGRSYALFVCRDSHDGRNALEDILRSGNCPLAEEFLMLCSEQSNSKHIR